MVHGYICNFVCAATWRNNKYSFYPLNAKLVR